MYIPKHFEVTDRKELLAFMQQYSFATLITSRNDRPTATHLPFVVMERGNDIVLYAHFAKANPQWQDIATQPALVIFTEPHAYVSPRHYDKELSVPTWNYVSVHAYGQGQLITDAETAFARMEQLINTYEADYQAQWERLPDDFRQKMLLGTVGFEITVTELQGGHKLSQNKTAAERERIAGELAASSHTHEQAIGSLMQQPR